MDSFVIFPTKEFDLERRVPPRIIKFMLGQFIKIVPFVIELVMTVTESLASFINFAKQLAVVEESIAMVSPGLI